MTVDKDGNVAAVGAGSAKVTVTTKDGAKKATVNFTVKTAEVAVTGVEATIDPSEIVVGKTAQVTATVAPANATVKTITYSSSDEKIATVDEKGVVTGVAVGEATIIATSANSKTATVKVTVNPVAVEKITMPETLELTEQDTKALETVVTPENATDASVTYTSSDEKIATVDEKGNVTAVLAGTATITATSVQNPEVTATCTVTVKALVLAVESVTPLNLKQFVIKFNKVVDKTSAEDKTNYKFDKVALVTGDVVKLNEDAKSVTVTLATAQSQQAVKEVAVENVKDLSGLKLSVYKTDITFIDLTIPTVVSAKQIGSNLVQVFFSEPVKGTEYLIDGGKYSATVKEYSDATNSVTLTTGTLAEGEHTLTVNSNTSTNAVMDYATLKVAKTDVKFTVAADKEAPTLVSAEAKSQKKVVLTFSESVDPTVLANNIYHTAETAAYQASAATAVAGSNNTQFEVTFTNAIPSGTATFIVSKEKAVDNYGNKNAAALQVTTTVAVDNVKPTVEEFKYVSTSTVEVTFSEEVTEANVKGNYKVTDKDGKAVSFSVAGYTDKDKKVTLTFSPVLKEAASYTVEITGIKDTAIVPNTIATYTKTFTATDVTGPTVQTTGVYNKTDRKITVFFNEAVDGTIALDKSKYTLKYDSSKELALPSDANVALGGNNTSVTITLPTTVKNAAGTDISASINGIVVGQVKDVAGNVSNTFTNVIFTTPSNIDTNNVIANSAKTTDTRTVQFEIDTPLEKIVAADFKVNSKDVEYATFENQTLSNGGYGALVTLKVAEDDVWATDVAPTITTNATTTSETLYGSKFTASLSPLATAADGVAPAIDNIVIKDSKLADGNAGQNSVVDTIEITFTENLKVGSFSSKDFDVSGYTVSGLTVAAKVVTLSIKETSTTANMTDVFNVTLKGNISDANDNVLAGDTTKTYKSIALTVPASPASTIVIDTTKILGTITTTGTGEEYSIDGGKKWDDLSASTNLTADQLSTLTVANGLKVRVKGTAIAPAGAVKDIALTASTAITVGTATYTKSTDELVAGTSNIAAGNYLWRSESASGTWNAWELVTLTIPTPFTVGATAPSAAGLKVELMAITSATQAPSAAVQLIAQ